MIVKTITIKAVRDALMAQGLGCNLSRVNPSSQRHARHAAYTGQQDAPITRCRVRALPTVGMGLMVCGDIASVAQRTQVEHGPGEVRQIWGIGFRALLNEVGSGVMR